MNVHKRAVVALSTATLGAGVVLGAPATAASASTMAVTGTAITSPTASASARWFTLYHGSKKGDWNTPSVKSRSKVLQVAFRCWNGGDGTKVRIAILQRINGHYQEVHGSRKWLCNGKTIHTRMNNAEVGGTYTADVGVFGKKHTTEVWVQNYG